MTIESNECNDPMVDGHFYVECYNWQSHGAIHRIRTAIDLFFCRSTFMNKYRQMKTEQQQQQKQQQEKAHTPIIQPIKIQFN